jgi:hypothetical protein
MIASPTMMPTTELSTFQAATSNVVTTFAGSGTYATYPTATYPGRFCDLSIPYCCLSSYTSSH